MAQFLRPASDVSDGAWLPSTGADLYATIDESSASDSDYNYTESESAFEVALSTGTDPSLSTGHIVRYRAAGDGALDLIVTLKQGATPIATWTESAASASFTDYSHTLSGGEADAITDYTALSLHFDVSAGGDTLTPVITDNFNRANETPLASPWTLSLPVGDNFNLASNSITPNSLVADCEMLHSTALNNDQYARAKITVNHTTSDEGIGVGVRMSTGSGGGGYRTVVSKAGSGNVSFGRRVAGAYTAITTRTTTWVDGDELLVTVKGTTIKIFQNGSQLGADITDANIASGNAGVMYSSTATSASLDDFVAGNVT